jgi:membrane protease YdiL (CAAX protease family)
METVAVFAFLWAKLLALALVWIVCIGVGIFAWGRQRLRDVGLAGGKVLPGIAYGIVWWALTVGAVVAIAFVRGTPVQWPLFEGTLGPLVKQLVVFASAEEIAFRGFIMAQLYLKLRGICSRSAVALTAALLVSQLFFALWHIPHRLNEHIAVAQMATNLALTLVAGILFCLVYVRTGNLLTALGVHAASNVGGLFAYTESFVLTQLIMIGGALILADLYARLERKVTAKFETRILPDGSALH